MCVCVQVLLKIQGLELHGETGHCESTELKLKRKESASAFKVFDHASVVDFGLCIKQKALEYFQIRTDL